MFVPRLMATQHPDSTIRISCRDEVLEAIEAHLKYKCDEIMIDYEGKLTPYHQVEWVVEKAVEYNVSVGEKFLLTPRVPRDDLEDVGRHIMSLVGSVLANLRAYRMGLEPPVRYVIIPMTEDVQDAVRVQRRLMKLERLLCEEAGYPVDQRLVVVPLVETLERQVHADAVVEAFHNALVREASLFIDTVRVFLGKSDSALKGGHIASTLSLKIAISRLARWSEERMIGVKIILGMGKPPFRGHFAPHNTEAWVREWSSHSTVTVQSALRYDTDYNDYIKLISRVLERQGSKPSIMEVDLESHVKKIILEASELYRRNLSGVLPFIGKLFNVVPSTRERVPHSGYGRQVDGKRLPRAIRFTAALYSAGIPPTVLDLEYIARADSKKLEAILETYPGLVSDLGFDLSFFNEEIAMHYMPKDKVRRITEAVRIVSRELGVDAHVEVGEEYWRHANRLARVDSEDEAKNLVILLAKERGFLG